MEDVLIRPVLHFRTLSDAVGVAAESTLYWRRPDDKTPIDIIEMVVLAEQYDMENPPEDGHSFYMTSAEGAIGFCPGAEFLTRWLFFPAAPPKPEPAPAPVAPLPRFCPNCGTPYRNDTVRFCGQCGTPRRMPAAKK